LGGFLFFVGMDRVYLKRRNILNQNDMFKEIDLLETGKILVTATAIIISVISLVKSNRNTKRQIRIGKLEEIIECLQFFIFHYKSLNWIYENQVFYKRAPLETGKLQLEHLETDYRTSVESFKKRVDMDKFQEITARLRVISNSYLPDNELKMKILSLVALITNLVNCTIFENFDMSRKNFKKYPDPLDFMNFISDIEMDILKEMNLGYKGMPLQKIQDYKSKFMEDLKISEN
jgi:hypothetical protein